MVVATLAAAAVASVALGTLGPARADSASRERAEEILGRVQSFIDAVTAQSTEDGQIAVVESLLWGPQGSGLEAYAEQMPEWSDE
jgi:hypothetical protein